ncbi:MAG: hypothetical protein ISS72_09100 [Candidatus Brocadiae bacterium]|nr:hypothetical protein [Candidatus Brocadiia bacterium]
MNRPVLILAVAIAVAGILVVQLTPSVAQDAPPQQHLVTAAVDISPIQAELAAVRGELAALRAAVTDEKGLRADVAKAAASIETLAKQMTELTEIIDKYTKATAPVIKALKPPQRWEYRVLRNRSDRSANHLGGQGWELVTGAADWLFFKRPMADGAPDDDGAAKPEE